MKAPTQCPKCGGEMRVGFILDHRLPSRWFSGEPDKSILGNISAHGREQHVIRSYRCAGCAYLELYAPGETS